VVVLKAAV